MNEKLKEFFQTKKELLVFLALLVVTFGTVIAIAEVTVFQDEVIEPNEDLNNDEQDDTTNDDLNNDEQDEDVVTPEPEVIYEFMLPTLGNQVVIRTFFDYATPNADKNDIIETNGGFMLSKGISYANEDNSSFDVVSIYSGTVLSVEEDEVMGTTITIDHGNDLVSVYYSLANSYVSEGDVVTSQEKIGVAGASAFDLNAGVHVHLEVISENEYVNFIDIVGKTMDDVVSSIK